VRLTPGAQPAQPVEPVAKGTAATAANASNGVPGHGNFMSWREVRDPQWAPAQEQAIQASLQKHIGISPDRYELECRTQCCRARLPKSLYDEHARELQSSVGLGVGDSNLIEEDDDGMLVTRMCFQRTDTRDPDRGAESDALLSAIRSELASCGRGLTHEVEVSMVLQLDESGAITKVDTRSDPTGEPAAACVERAVVAAAAFAPASGVTRLPVKVTLPLR
jgi:hypothetical protein